MQHVAASPGLLVQLHATARDRRWVHHVDCDTYAEDGQARDCSCGVPDLLAALDALLGPGVNRAVGEAQRAA